LHTFCFHNCLSYGHDEITWISPASSIYGIIAPYEDMAWTIYMRYETLHFNKLGEDFNQGLVHLILQTV